MSELGTTTYESDNLFTATKPKITADVLQLEAGQNVVRGEVLKKGTTGLVALTATTDIPYVISTQNIDATAAAKNIVYSYDCSVKESELTYGAGDISNFRDKFVTETSILVEE